MLMKSGTLHPRSAPDVVGAWDYYARQRLAHGASAEGPNIFTRATWTPQPTALSACMWGYSEMTSQHPTFLVLTIRNIGCHTRRKRPDA